LLDEVLGDVLLRPVVWDNVVHGIAHVTSFGRRQELKLIPAGANNYIAALYTALRNKGVNTVCTKGCSETERGQQTDTLSKCTDDFITPSGKSKIAVVGMSGRFPNANDIGEYWDIITKGLDTHEVVPTSRWSLDHVDAEGKRKNTSRTPYGCWLKDPGLFDAPFFGISPREASQMDPASRIALMTTYEAMEQAGMVPDATPSTIRDRVGVFYGVTSNDWMEVNSAQNIDTYFIPGGCRAFIPGRINYSFRFTGPSLAIDIACSSSMAALHTACNALWQGDIDTAISGGTNVLTNPDYTAGLDKGHFLSRTGNCKTFDETADGYCRGEGVCTFILKRLEDAVAENDPILGVIAGALTNHSAEAESITRPHSDIQKAAFRTLMTDTGLKPEDIGYVEMHGTGTQAGDVAEIRSVVDAFAPTSDPKSNRTSQDLSRPLYVGSVKANIGHGEAASGVSSVAKALLMLKHDTIPAHCGIKTKVNSKFPNLKNHNVHITPKSIAWSKDPNKARRICVNNFSAAGGNSAVLIEDAPVPLLVSHDPRESHIVTLSSRSSSALNRNAESLLSFLARPPSADINLSSIEYSTTVRRMHHSHRLAVCASTPGELESGLREDIYQYKPEKSTKRRRPITFAFTGNGTGFPGMAKHYSENFPSFRENLVHLDNLIQAQGFPSIVPFCCSPTQNDTKYPDYVIQLAVVCYEIALARLWISWGVIPDTLIGHSLGEYAALNVAGVLSDADTIQVVGKRAQLLQEKCTAGTHAMLAISAPREQISSFVQASRCELACINGHDDTVVSGESSAIRDLYATLRSIDQSHHPSSTICIPLSAGGCHSERFQKCLSRCNSPQTKMSCTIPSERFGNWFGWHV
jgi:acyl transferase domain-containing protein